MQKLKFKLHNLFFTEDRFLEYYNILILAKQRGYTFYTMLEFSRLLKANAFIQQPFMLLRHDIDTDSNAALLFAKIENRLHIHATYFFRIKTWKDIIIQRLFLAGHEIGYHNEETADYAVKHHIKTALEINLQIPAIRLLFEQRLSALRKGSNLRITGIASHGDFANVRLNVGNFHILADEAYRRKMSIEYEAYDEDIWAGYVNHVSDKPYPELYMPVNPMVHIQEGVSFLFLTHPRWWRNNTVCNLQEEISCAVKRWHW